MFATKGFHARNSCASFLCQEQKPTVELNRAGKNADVKKRWNFVDQVKSSSYGQAEVSLLEILKVKLARGQIGQAEYKLRQTLAA